MISDLQCPKNNAGMIPFRVGDLQGSKKQDWLQGCLPSDGLTSSVDGHITNKTATRISFMRQTKQISSWTSRNPWKYHGSPPSQQGSKFEDRKQRPREPAPTSPAHTSAQSETCRTKLRRSGFNANWDEFLQGLIDILGKSPGLNPLSI